MQRLIMPIAAAAALFAAWPAQVRAEDGFSDDQKRDIETIVRDYLVENPEVLVEAFQVLESRQAEQQAAAQKTALTALSDQLTAVPAGAVLGNPEGDVTVVEFFDYNCGFCKRGLEAMNSLLDSDPQLRFVLRELPILSEQSQAASRVSLAVQKIAPEKYGDFHRELLGSKGLVDEDRALEVASDLGIEEAGLKSAMADPEIDSELTASLQLAHQLAINGTPAYIIADEIVPGAVGFHSLAQKIANVRQCDSTTC
ncbi:DsbA family protein [Consotaella aegiceratis]|uniref:DsbA family protein n=1 Tax=Consotaella aegiceratis TaxID=3097961 RepID=UPI002F428685